jgi:FKBP-type peptidyl-prolyl cis-trans isomerase
MRRIAALLVLPLLAVGVLAGCGSGSASATGTASSGVSVSGAFGQAPVIKIPAAKAGHTLAVKTVIRGSGPVLHSADTFVSNFVIYVWSGTAHRLAQSTFGTVTHPSSSPELLSGQLLPGLEKALIGQKMGSRVLAVIPPKEGFGTAGNPQVGIKGTDTLVFVVDLIKNFAGNAAATGTPVSSGGHGLPTVTAAAGAAPTIKMPASKPPTKLVTKTLVQGNGAVITKGQTVVVQYVGAIWATGKVFDASWNRSQPFGFVIDSTPTKVIPGWDQGLTGQRVGSRVMLVIPPAEGYGKTGNPQAGIKGTDTLVFVVDILGAFG